MLDDGEAEVRVGRGVAVAGKVLGRRDHAAVPDAADVRAGHVRHELHILAERADVDDRIPGVVVDVDDGIEVDGDAERTALFGRQPSGAIGQLGVSRGADRHRARQPRRAGHHVADAALEVGGREEREVGFALQAIQHRRRHVRIAFARRPVP